MCVYAWETENNVDHIAMDRIAGNLTNQPTLRFTFPPVSSTIPPVPQTSPGATCPKV